MNNKDFKQQLIARAFNFAKKIIALVDNFPRKRSSLVISDQLLRSATSVGANIIEAQAASSRKDFINFLNHALKSGNETKFRLALAIDLDPKLTKETQNLLKESEELTKILGSIVSKLRGKSKY